ncbi:hypothetical protein RhiirA4_470022 [Rhizophagus irregularis]|uniref:Uncharacterized protein n=1 Tax=Rhizophagus irregularis TaxID=588596 RepID=A0A2I1H0K5_9GLOM|nr:hypothetical protein RhiirA4_470022 [Rhizophagus irregularis]
MDKYRFLSTILYNIGGFGDSGFRPELGNGDRFRPVNLKLGSPAIRIWGPISARNSEIETGGEFRPGTQKWKPILARNLKMETDFSPELGNDFSPELGNGDRDMDSWIIIQTVS